MFFKLSIPRRYERATVDVRQTGMETDEPLVTVVIPCFNGELYVREAIQSVATQTSTSWVLIIIDDGSTDSSPKILREAVTRLGERARVVRTENQGACAARNAGLKLASTKYVAFLDSDDLWMEEKLTTQLKMLAEDSRLVGVTSDYFLTNSRGEPRSRQNSFTWSKNAMIDWTLLGRSAPALNSTLIVDRLTLLSLGGYNEGLVSYGEDLELGWRLRAKGAVSYAPRALALVRIWSGQIHNDTPQMISSLSLVYDGLREREPDLAEKARVNASVYAAFRALKVEPSFQALLGLTKCFLIAPKISFLYIARRAGCACYGRWRRT
jgi:glycosyltransferase involved in cell wall biosynthesis